MEVETSCAHKSVDSVIIFVFGVEYPFASNPLCIDGSAALCSKDSWMQTSSQDSVESAKCPKREGIQNLVENQTFSAAHNNTPAFSSSPSIAFPPLLNALYLLSIQKTSVTSKERASISLVCTLHDWVLELEGRKCRFLTFLNQLGG
ncbi:hypothetical protein CDAR_212601 [Caerostris darwini]|uniref:Uncharacterized protein n=1 Tax=Caerostris darwini TaxID=1538125 RepID=A0AAV4PY75_9ARAC|nr:hypothetical protein CDAR_212601 [Caerostris darwini]